MSGLRPYVNISSRVLSAPNGQHWLPLLIMNLDPYHPDTVALLAYGSITAASDVEIRADFQAERAETLLASMQQALLASERDRAATVLATQDAQAVIDAARGQALYLRGEVLGGIRLYSLDPDRIRANSVTIRAAGTNITTSAVRVRFT